MSSFSYSAEASQDRDPENFEIKEASVTAIHKRQVPGYYVLKTESGKEIKVTGEHPFLAVKKEPRIENLEQTMRRFFEGIWEKVKGMVK